MTSNTTTPIPAAPAARERPILFSAPMVRALLAGTKTQTRRVMRDQVVAPGIVQMARPGYCEIVNEYSVRIPGFYCPYGKPGDRLWVRENHYLTDNGDEEYAVYAADGQCVREHLKRVDGLAADFPADVRAQHRRLRPSIHMPRWASRILLAITDVRVDRLQDISDADALAEGVRHSYGEPFDVTHTISDRRRYALLWDQINGAGAWAANPWVWAVSFRSLPSTGGNSISLPQGSTALHRRESS